MPWNWDPTKNEDNKAKHRVPFEIARQVFRDENALTYDDPYPDEPRFRTIGRVEPSLLIVIHTEEDPDPLTGERAGRIISARKATLRERAIYEEK